MTMDVAPILPSSRGSRPQRRGRLTERTATIWGGRLAILVTFIASWEYLPKIDWLRDLSVVFDPYYVSSPSLVTGRLRDLLSGSNGQPELWPFFWQTMQGTILGIVIGTVSGAVAGLLLSNNELSRKLASPFLAVLNATPRIALIPVIVIIAGPTLTATVLTAVLVIFFLVFYNAFAGGSSVAQQTIQNARLMGATSGEIMRTIRLPHVVMWTFTSLPNAVSFGLVSVVTAELLTGKTGMGLMLQNSITFSDSTGTFAVVSVLAVVGVALVLLAEYAERRVLFWRETA